MIELPGKGNFARSRGRILGIVDGIEFFDFVLGIIGDHHFNGAQHREAAQGPAIEVLAHRVFEHGDVGDAVDTW